LGIIEGPPASHRDIMDGSFDLLAPSRRAAVGWPDRISASVDRSRVLLVLGAVAAAGAAVATAVNVGRSPIGDPEAWPIVRGLVVVSYAFVGSYVWLRSPISRLGPFLVGIALLYAVASMSASQVAVAHTVGRATLAVIIVALVYVFLCYPHDALHTRGERRLVRSLGLITAVLWLLALLLVERLPAAGPLTDCDSRCPDNAFRVLTPPHVLSSAIVASIGLATAAGLVALVVMLRDKARSATRLRRRMVVPVLCGVVALVVNYAAYTLLRQAGADGTSGLRVLGAAAAFAVPLTMLVGQVRGRAFALESLGQLVSRVGGEPLTPVRAEALLREALGDPTLTLAFKRPGHAAWVAAGGETIDLAVARRDVAVTRVVREGSSLAVIHDAALADSSRVTEGLAATALLLLENAELIDELRASRARIVASAQRERLRLERNLHDGAQQRLFVIQTKVRAAQARAGEDGLAGDLGTIAEDAAAAVEELRALAHGLYPAVLRERGLADGLRSAARTAVVPVTVVDRGLGRCSPTVEEAVYFCVLEAVQNAAKHGGAATRVTVTLRRRGAGLEFAVEDDGIGFRLDEDADGVGLVSMRDRMGAVGGELEVESYPGQGTTVRGRARGCGPSNRDEAGVR
jgi:signal transduction histidine kinase